MQINLQNFIKGIEAVPPAPAPPESVSPYLYEKVVRPILEGYEVRLGMLDLDAFTGEELNQMLEFAVHMRRKADYPEYLMRRIEEKKPAEHAAVEYF